MGAGRQLLYWILFFSRNLLAAKWHVACLLHHKTDPATIIEASQPSEAKSFFSFRYTSIYKCCYTTHTYIRIDILLTSRPCCYEGNGCNFFLFLLLLHFLFSFSRENREKSGQLWRFKPSNPLFNIVTKEDFERVSFSLSDLYTYRKDIRRRTLG